MCGIAGWVDFTKDLRAERDTAQAMTDSMSLRGPDDGGLWLSEHAAIGHRRLAVIDPPGGAQPMVEDEVVLTYSGEVYNHSELRAELTSAGHTFRTHSDTEVVLRAYLQWGVELAHRLNGMYAFAIWDGRSEELLLVRDRLGVKPLYYHPLPGGLLFGSEPKAILANPLVARAVDPAGFCASLTMLPDPEGRTPFRDILDLHPAHHLRCTRAGVERRRYWALEARPHEDDLPRTIATVRELLEDIVERQLVSDVPLCSLLSGGLDSSVLTALGQRAAGRDGGRLRSFAVDFSGYAENFQADAYRETADRPYVHEMVRHVGCEHLDITLDNGEMLDPATRAAVMRAWDMPNHLVDLDLSLYLLFRAIREHSTVAISGEAADEIFGGYPWMDDPAVLQIPIFPWMVEGILRGGPPMYSLFDPELIESLKLGEYVVNLYNDSLAAVPRLDGEEGEEARMREVIHLHLNASLRRLLDRKDRMSMAVGLEVRVPFCDHRLMEYVFNAPWSMKKCDGREKSLLREATADLLPETVLQRKKAGFPSTQDIRYDRAARVELERILGGEDDDPILPHLDVQATRALIDEPLEEVPTTAARFRVENVLRTNAWLKEYQLDLGGI
jgi:asparagine synthase (glutamine-hydrolysing)